MNTFIAEVDRLTLPSYMPCSSIWKNWKIRKELKYYQVSFPYENAVISVGTNSRSEIIALDENKKQIIFTDIINKYFFLPLPLRHVFKDNDGYLCELRCCIKHHFYINDEPIYSFISPSSKKEYCISNLDLNITLDQKTLILKTSLAQLNKIQILVSYIIWRAYCRSFEQ